MRFQSAILPLTVVMSLLCSQITLAGGSAPAPSILGDFRIPGSTATILGASCRFRCAMRDNGRLRL